MKLSQLKKILSKEAYEYAEQKYKTARHSSSDSATDLEPDFRNGSLGKKKAARFDTPVRIRVHSKRRRLADADGISAKAAIDGLKHCGVLRDDSPKEVTEVSYTQELSKEEEETIITIELKEM